MKLASFNVHYCVGKDGRYDPYRIAELMRDIDIVGLQEVEVNWDRSGNSDQPAALAAALPHHFTAWGPGVDMLKTSDEPLTPTSARRRQFGNMILSKYPILTVRNLYLPRRGAVDALYFQRSALEVVVDTPNGAMRVYCTHLCNLSTNRRIDQLSYLLDMCANANREGSMFVGRHRDLSWSSEGDAPKPPVDAVILGDLNFTPQEPEYELIAGDYNPYGFGRLRFVDGFADAWTAAGHPDDSIPGAKTIPDACTHFAAGDRDRGMRIDYCFVSSSLLPRLRSAELIQTDISDHYPVVVELQR